MQKFLKNILFFTSALLLFPAILFAQVSKIGFVTEDQTIKPNILSEPITIQTQDSSGASLQTPETIDLVFTSSSPTGEFLNSSGNPATKTMNANTANRTFYYRDSTEGSFTLKVEATGRTSGQKWEASQKITISSGAIVRTSGESLIESAESSVSSSESATSGSASVTYSTPSSELQVSAGSDRLTSPGSPISFQATIKRNSSSNGGVIFGWSYGDGEVGSGALVSHSYKYPGEYAVVLNAKAGNNFAVSRLKVRVVEPNLAIGFGDGYVELSNNSDSEINLFNWKIIHNGKGFVFQPDTIVLPKSKIKIDNSLFTMKSETEGRTVLRDALGREVLNIVEPMSKGDKEKAVARLNDMQKSAMSLLDEALAKGLVFESSSEPKVFIPQGKGAVANVLVANEDTIEEQATTSNQSLDNVIYEAPKNQGVLSRAWQFLLGMLH